MQSDTKPTRLARRWRWLVGAAFSLALAVGGYFAWLYADWHRTRSAGEKRLAQVEQELDETDPDWRPERLFAARNAALPPPDKNATDLALAAESLIPDSFRELFDGVPAFPDLELGVRAAPERVEEYRTGLKPCAAALTAAQRIGTVPAGGSRVVLGEPNSLETPLEQNPRLRQFVALYSAQAIVEADGGRTSAALASVSSLMDVTRAVGDEPFLISQIVRMSLSLNAAKAAEWVLGMGEASPEALANLQRSFAAEIDFPRLLAVRGDRAALHRLLERIDSGALPIDSLAGQAKSAETEIGFRVVKQHIPAQQAMSLELFNQLVAAARLPHGPERTAVFDDVTRAVVRMPKDAEHLFVRLLFPAVQMVNVADARVVGQLRCAVAGLACERFRLKTGRFPSTLAELPEDLLPEIMNDPFTGNPLIFKATEQGVVVYCTGPDKKDDGGSAIDQKGTPGTDLGFRVLHPQFRRQAPRKPPAPAPDDE